VTVQSTWSTTRPMCFARGRNGDVYGVNGLERGVRYDVAANVKHYLGLAAPTVAPALTSSGSSAKYYVAGVDVQTGGFNYDTTPAVVFSGGDGTGAAAKAELSGSRISRITMLDYGSGYTSAPTVSVGAPNPTSPAGSGAAFTVAVSGKISDILPVTIGAGYITAPTVTVTGGGGSGAILTAEIDSTSGAVIAVNIVNSGSGYTSTPSITFSNAPGGGTTASATAVVTYAVTGVTVDSAGSGYTGAPKISFVSSDGSGALAVCAVDSSTGSISGVAVKYGGAYRVAPTASIETPAALIPKEASVVALMKPAIKGKYWCAFRFVDATPAGRDGPIASSLSPLGDIEVSAAAGSISWTLTLTGKDADRTDKIELWRSTADQALVLYRVATVSAITTTYTDTVSDADLIDPNRTVSGERVFAALPIVLPNGQVNAYRFNPPPQNKSAVVMFQDRAWYAVDAPGRTFDGTSDATAAEPNSLYFSEVDEPESVPETNELIIQTNVRGADSITALMPFGAGMVVFQHRHAYRLAYVAQPVIDASVQLICQRGCLNQRCWDTYDGVAYVADSMGMYVLDGSNAVPISDVVDTYWANSVINFSSSAWFFVRVDPVTRIARFFFNESGTYPDRALCYHPVTKAWWLETYAQRFSSSECLLLGKRQRVVLSGQSTGIVLADDGAQDIDANGSSSAISCDIRTGNMSLSTDGASRSIRVLYKPTSTSAPLTVNLHYNNSSTARPNAISSDRGTGFTASAGGGSVLEMQLQAAGKLQDATGYATCMYAGRVDDRSSGGDRHLAVAYSATRPASDQIVLYGTAIDGVAQ
jgi:hypothetical protein